MMLSIVFTILFAISEPELLPLNQTVLLNPDILLNDEVLDLFEASDLVFSVKSVTRRISILGWSSEKYDLEIGEELKGNLPEETAYMYTFPCGMYSRQFASLSEGGGSLVVFATRPDSSSSMEGLYSFKGTFSVYLYTPTTD